MRWISTPAVVALLRRVIRDLRFRLDPTILKRNLRPPLLLLHLDLLNLLLKRSALGLSQQAQISYGDDGEQHEETHHVDSVTPQIPQVDGRGS